MRGKILNKHARRNICILDEHEQEPDYSKGMGRILKSSKIQNPEGIPVFENMKKRMVSEINENSGSNGTEKASNMIAEGNYYYNPSKCGIGFHGDKERRKVFCVSLGVSSVMKWVWYKNSKPENKEVVVKINNGDLYIMSEKAVGYDWGMSSMHTIRHSAGCARGFETWRWCGRPGRPKCQSSAWDACWGSGRGQTGCSTRSACLTLSSTVGRGVCGRDCGSSGGSYGRGYCWG